MRSTKVAARYAKSLIDLAIEQNKLEDTYQDMCLIHKVCEDNRDFELLLASPIVKSDKKAKILDAVLACLLYTSPSPRDQRGSRMPSSA